MKVERMLASAFREAEVGAISTDWECVSFDKATFRKRVSVGKVKTRDYLPFGEYPIVDQSTDFIAGYWDDSTAVYAGDLPVIIFGDHTRIFKFVNFRFVCGADGTKIIQPNTDIFDPSFLFHAFQNIDLPSRGYNRHFKLLKEQFLQCPPLPEQRRIAAALNAIQDAIAAQDELIRALREFKRGVMARLFTYGAGEVPAETKMTDAGEIQTKIKLVVEQVISGDWGEESDDPTKDLTRCTVIRGTDFPNAFAGMLTNAPMRYIRSSRIAKKRLRQGDILIEISGGSSKQPTGRVLRITSDLINASDGPLICTNFVKLLRLDYSSVDADYFAGYWQYLYELGRTSIYEKRTTGIRNFKHVEFMQNEKIPLPSLAEQRTIAHVLTAIDDKIFAEEDRKAALQDFFRSALQQLMTGQIRLLSDEGLPL